MRVMIALSWRIKKKLSFFITVFLVIAGTVAIFTYFSWPQATCEDGKKNQKEEGVDCGGPCTPCVVNPKDVVALWSRVFQVSPGVYEAAALVENPNLSYGLPLFKYTFKVYDSNNILVAVEEGQSFLNPGDKFVVFKSNINVGEREVVRAFVEIENLSPWVYLGETKSTVVVSQKSFSNFPSPVLNARLTNQSLFTVKDVEAIAVLYDQDKNVVGVSSTRLNEIGAESSDTIIFTWPLPFSVEPVSNKIFTRAELGSLIEQ